MMTSEKLAELEEWHERCLSDLEELKTQYPKADLSALSKRLDSLGSILSDRAIKLDVPDEPIVKF
jgi:hypothetical protein